MSANSNLEIVNLDFFTLKNNLKKYLTSQDQFKDYDFEGSNLSVLLDLLAYNTYINSFYTNMAISEMFLDSAQIRDSVLSHSKELNYLPRSFQSSRAEVNITVTPANATPTVTILKGTSLTSRVGSDTYSFIVDENIVLTSTNGVFLASNVAVFEGELVNESFIYNPDNNISSLTLSNPTVDTRSISVFVYEDNGENVLEYTRGTTFLGLNANSQTFFVQPARGELYEIVFGNGTQGREPKPGSVVLVSYRICNGELPNGAAIFSINSLIDGHSNVSVTTARSAEGGLVSESIQSIKKNAPRFFQTQERAVTALDYKTALQLQFPEIENINVFGGETADPPQYGKVFCCVDLQNSDGVPLYKKEVYKEYIRTITPLSIDPVFIDPEFMYLTVNTNVVYNLNKILITETSLRSLVENKILTFNEFNLNSFDISFRYSRLVSDIDTADASVISNDTEVVVYKEITPSVISENTFTLDFINVLNNPFSEAATTTHRAQDQHAIYSSTFTFENQLCRFEDDNAGLINIVSLSGEDHIIIKPIGTVNYETGKISISKFLPSSYPPGPIRVFAVTQDKDINALRNNIIKIKPSDISIALSGVRE